MNLGNTGSAGEEYATKFLSQKGYEIITRNYHSRYGEIDIICKYDRYIVFVEVKTRGRTAIATGREAVNPSKQRKILKTALLYLSVNNNAELQPRFDIVEITVGERVTVQHIENAFDGSALHGFI